MQTSTPAPIHHAVVLNRCVYFKIEMNWKTVQLNFLLQKFHIFDV